MMLVEGARFARERYKIRGDVVIRDGWVYYRVIDGRAKQVGYTTQPEAVIAWEEDGHES